MILIVAVDENFSIGLDGHMLFHLDKDLERFKKITTGHILVMGRKTLESLPGGKPLPDRDHIVLTRDENYEKEGVKVVNDISQIQAAVDELDPDHEKEVFLIGGGNIVDQMLDMCELAYVTKVKKTYENFDSSIPNLDRLDNWDPIWHSKIQKEEEDGEVLEFTYNTYRNKKFR